MSIERKLRELRIAGRRWIFKATDGDGELAAGA